MNWLYLAAPWGSGVGGGDAGGTITAVDDVAAWLIILASVAILALVIWLTKRNA